MYLSRIYIKNYRSIKELDLQFTKGKNVLVGRNNAGKSNIIRALDLVLGENSPTWAKSDNVTDNDFYSWKEVVGDTPVTISANEFHIWCELTRDDGEVLNYDEIYKCAGFYVYSHVTNPNYPRQYEPTRIPRADLPHKPQVIGIPEDDNSEKQWINPKNRNQATFESQFEGKKHFAFSFFAYKDSDGKIHKEMRFLYRESGNHNWILSFRATVRNELLQSAIIPSFRDPQNQLRLSNWTWYGKLMKHLTENHAKSKELQDAFSKVKDVADGIFASVKTTIVQSSLAVAFPGTELFFQFNADTKTDLYKNTVIYVDDGFKSQLTEKGSGIQSATIIGLFNYYTRNVNTVTSALLCIEEPEIYLHPHARRVISDRLDDFLEGGKNQVILTTHSSEFVRSTSPDLNVIMITRDQANATSGRNVQVREFKDLLLDNNQNEMFFADKVIVCEGFEGYLLRLVANCVFPKKLDELNITVVFVGGKDNISRMVKLVNKLGLKCFVLADFDYLLRDKSSDAEKYENGRRHESLLSCGEDYFAQQHIFGDQGKAVFDELQKLRSELKSENEERFYCTKSFADFANTKLPDFLSLLRRNGIGILGTDIEGTIVDKTLLREAKVKLETIFDVNARISQGENIERLMQIGEIAEFLNTVLSR